MIGPGATAPGGWLRVAKEGGKHLTLERRVHRRRAPARLQRPRLHAAPEPAHAARRASAGGRSSRATYTLETTSALEVVGQPQPRRARPRAALRAEHAAAPAQLLVGLPGRRLRAGALRRPRGRRRHGAASAPATSAATSSSPAIRAVSCLATLANQTQLIGARHLRDHRAGERRRPRPPASSTSSSCPSSPGRPASTATPWQSSIRRATLLFGKLTAKSVSATLRATYTFTPQLTLQTYAQAFLASGHFDRPPAAVAAARAARDHGARCAALHRRARRCRPPPADPRLRGGGAQRQRRLPLGVPPRLDDLPRLHPLADSDRPGGDAGWSRRRRRSPRTRSATARRRTSSC